MLHHWLEEQDILKHCIYCHNALELEKWGSHFHECGKHHYKVIKCQHCKKENQVKVDHLSSGCFDKWPNKIKTRTLEKTVSKQFLFLEDKKNE